MTQLSAPRDSTIRRLFALSMNQCAFPDCLTPILDPKTNTILAEVCHIHAKSDKGLRYDPDQTPEERHGFENLILMCGVHHKIIDAPENLPEFPAERLFEIKAEHEKRARESGRQSLFSLTRTQINELKNDSVYVGQHVTHMDFRHAVLNAGGEGGKNGGGGGGGVITIVGSTQAPPEAKLKLDGQSPGGGGGALNFVGRPSTPDDVVNGLRVSSIFTANSFHFDHGTFHVLGGGWANLPLKPLPSPVSILLVCVVELGSIVENTLIRCDIDVIDPQANKVASEIFDVSVSSDARLVARHTAMRLVKFDANEAGVWTFKVSSGGIPLADYDIEIGSK